MGAYVDALGRFKLMAQNLYGGPADTPDISGGYAAAMLRYLKDRAASLKERPCEPWELVGREVARVGFAARVPETLRARLWSWARCVCQAADEEGLAFVQVKPDPKKDHALLVKMFGEGPTKPTTPRDDQTDQQNLDQPGDDPSPSDLYVDPDLETSAKKPPPKSTGDQINLGLFLIAVIVIGTVFHRR